MQRIAAPMVGGMISAPLVSMLLIPLLTYLLYAAKGFGAEKATEAKGDAV
jgi:Cu(I)/Ag(I) efflux system membrane protein CusA/SilA